MLPGTHCGNITVGTGQTMLLLPGEHYFRSGTLRMQNNSTLTGSDVVLVFNDNASFAFTELVDHQPDRAPERDLRRLRDRHDPQTTPTPSPSRPTARAQLEGAVYIPDATLLVTGTGNQVADQSAWTVVVAKGLQLSGSPNLVINANYAGSNVPVPAGAGSNYHSGNVVLSR